MIIWLASYPKSGNTWVKIFLNSILFSKAKIDINKNNIRLFPLRSDFNTININVDNIKDFADNCLYAQELINLDNKIKFFKTHNALWKLGKKTFTNEENTLGVLHIVRDPRNVITSLKNHFNIKNYEDALVFLKDEKKSIGSKSRKKESDLPTIISSWSNHYNSWKKMEKNNLLIKYENLLKNPLEEFMKISEFIEKISKLKFQKEEIEKAVINCGFEKLQEQEKQNGFVEALEKRQFFYLGPKNNWKSLLEPKIQNDIEENFKKEMIELGYL
jgi:hypothetical protein